MNYEIINSYIDKHTQKMEKPVLLLFALMSVGLYAICLYLLREINNYVLPIVLSAILIAQFIYYLVISRQKVMTIYIAIGVNFTLYLQFILLGFVGLFFSEKKTGNYDPTWFAGFLIVGVLSILCGFLCSVKRLKSNTGRIAAEGTAILVIPLIATFGSRILRRFVNNNAPEAFKDIYDSLLLATLLCILLFLVGSVHVTILYLIKKYKIPNREIEHLTTDKSS